jgi:hypothetical protein
MTPSGANWSPTSGGYPEGVNDDRSERRETEAVTDSGAGAYEPGDLAERDEFDEFDDFDDFGDDEPGSDAFLDDGYDGHAAPTPIRRFEASAAGVVSAAWMNGLRNALFGPQKQEVTIVTDWAGDPPFTDPYVLRLDPDHPEDSIVMVRPWLKDGAKQAPSSDHEQTSSD